MGNSVHGAGIPSSRYRTRVPNIDVPLDVEQPLKVPQRIYAFLVLRIAPSDLSGFLVTPFWKWF